MGFLSTWDEPRALDISDLSGDEPGTWIVRIRRCLTHGQESALQSELVASALAAKNGRPTPEAAMRYQSRVIESSILGWNLTDATGSVLPCGTPAEIRASLDQLPGQVYARIMEGVMEGNTQTSSERAAFPIGSLGGDEDVTDDAPHDLEILV